MIKHLAIIGVGLIGGSLALALKKAGLVEQVTGYSRSKTARDEALTLGIIDCAAESLAEAVADADMVFVAVPMGAMQSVFEQITPHLKSQAIITDGGSAKQQVVDAARQALGDKFDRFVPGHPIAGTEKSGPSAAFAELYQQHRVVLTPVAETDSSALQQVRQMWQQAGADVFEMEVEHHDVVLAATSHLPHVLAFNLVGMLAQREDCDEVLRYAAGGFRDFSRIASSDAVMWRDICLGNRNAILELLQQYRHGLDKIEQAIRQDDGEYLIDIFGRAKRARDTRFADPDLQDNSEV
ncbi:prephenate dehydrogenase [Methylophaga pinxianii]|uniref:prephenate dehydrogenase n=1 Tax=Methylophaga pinxianii TaxID=2881052 RepID=UPI001CF336B9|nr:prephenate dehydrogenase/arogenate dehydrogenase family protein [Methylophaga pinxianii]MCB2427401.1 prephenate dehydrogenase/arogenate dehydrogenase family protein [Methylophaga pinxianii]UPH45192.1 prephenate dehydrogenase/arogenate dehydrogenase family protein [Methylophaga pinxianii]